MDGLNSRAAAARELGMSGEASLESMWLARAQRLHGHER